MAFYSCQQQPNHNKSYHSTSRTELFSNSTFNPNPALIRYSRHAQCRMKCRHITEEEIKEIIHYGKIDYHKSALQADDCHKRYALEGTTAERQYLRVIVAECNNVLTVITCIDLREDWPCSCH
ncbi:MAG: DUF4258 domain-containing protein [Bacteroidota bacterium]|nr:DUF4258 domain-containing protein [Bacteroidota bacterium]